MLFTEEILRKRVQDSFSGFSGNENYFEKAENILNESIFKQRLFSSQNKEYDIFLSHSFNDAVLIAGLKLQLEDLGLMVYVDWIDDFQLNRDMVTKETATLLKVRMKKCKTLIYAFSESSSNSKWMPWELGYFDGIKGMVAVLPITKSIKHNFIGEEYLGIYYYIKFSTILGSNTQAIWVHETQTKYMIFNEWLKGFKPTQR